MFKLTPFEKILMTFFIFIATMICCRIYLTGSPLFIFLVWNIFLAWIPFRLTQYLDATGKRKYIKNGALLMVWLLFFPNALYIITDLIHLGIDTTVPKWFDAILLFSAAIAGLMMAFISLFRVERYLAMSIARKWMPVLILFIIFLGSFGVYLGRFLRWNSWDILSNPLQLLLSIGHRVVSPFDHIQTWGITFIFTIFFYLLYVLVKKMPGYLERRHDGFPPSDAFSSDQKIC